MAMKYPHNPKWGGKRAGSGRKKTGKNVVNVTLTLTKSEKDELEKMLARYGFKSVSKMIVKMFGLDRKNETQE